MYFTGTLAASQHWFRRPLFPFAIAALAIPCWGASSQQLALNGVWAVGSETACSTSPYQLQADNSIWKFTDRNGTTNVERVVQSANGLYVTETVSSPEQPVGTRWEYRFQGPSRAEVRNLLNRKTFTIVRCPGPPQTSPAVAATGLAQSVAEASVKTFLAALYAPYSQDRLSDLGDARAPRDAPERLLEPSLAVLWRKSASIKRDEPGPIDGDPICSCQEANISDLQITVRVVSPAEAVGTASFKIDADPRSVTYSLIAVGGNWRIQDILSGDDRSSLRQTLEKDVAAARPQPTQAQVAPTTSPTGNANPVANPASAFDACMNSAKTNLDFSRCGGDEIVRQEKLLSEAWKRVSDNIKGYGDDSFNALLAEQREWIKLKDISCKYYQIGFGREGQAIAFPICLINVLKSRVESLNNLDRDLQPH